MNIVLKAQIHNATVTGSNIHETTSCILSAHWLEAANIQEYEQIHIYNMNSGNKYTTFVIATDDLDSVILNGDAANCGIIWDKLIICAYRTIIESEPIPKPIFIEL